MSDRVVLSILFSAAVAAGCGSSGQNAGGGGQPSSGGAAGVANQGGAPTGGQSNGGSSTGGSTANGGTPATGGTAGTGASATGGAATGGTGGTAATNEYYVAPNGSDSNPGTDALPFATLNKADSVAGPGVRIWVKAGTYDYDTAMSLTHAGTDASPIELWAVAGARPVLDFSSEPRNVLNPPRGIELQGDYWHIKGLEIINAADNGLAISGSHNVIELVVLHGNEDTGLQITVPSGQVADNTRGAYNLILNCDSYENVDVRSGGENADGFAPKLRIGPGNVFRGCRAWANADDGWDLFASDDVVTIDGCWAFLNGKPPGGGNPAGDGNGFKLGGTPNGAGQGGAVHIVTWSASFENLTCGFVRNNNPDVPSLSDCYARSNPTGDYCQVTCNPTHAMTMTSAQAKAVVRNADGSLPAVQ